MDAAARSGGHPPRMSSAYPFLRGVGLYACARRRTYFCVRCRQPQGFRWLLRCNIRRTRFCAVGPARFCGYVGGTRAGEPLPSAGSNSKKNLVRTRFCVPEGAWKDHSGRRAYLFLHARCAARAGPRGRPYPFLRRPRAAPDLVRCSRAYPILRGAKGRVVSRMACRARPGVLAVGARARRRLERSAWPFA